MIKKKFFLDSVVVSLILFLAFLIYNCKDSKIESDYFSPDIVATHYNGEKFVGSKACIECHADIYALHQQTAHFNTSSISDSISIKGSFDTDSNLLDLESVKFTMLSEGGSFYQHTEIKNRLLKKPPERFDISVGSGVRGQSYLTWKNDSLFQLQTSYYTPTNSWVNSPGFPSYSIDRPVREACIKCHVTFAKTTDFSGQGNRFDKKQMMYGVDCERCHRPAEKHVAYHKNNPDAKTSEFMLKFGELSRQQRLDACAQCHSGLRDRILKGNSFSFLTGDNLDEHAQNINVEKLNEPLDVHGNQYGLLTRSKCFKQAETMDCSTCHDSHENQRGNTVYFNQKCITCHAESAVCTEDSAQTKLMGNNCISCHMPTTPSKSMTVQIGNDSLETSFSIRTHLIAIYPDGI